MRLHLLIGFLLLAATGAAQYNVEAYSPANGLVDAKVSFLYQDSLGRMLFLTRDGFSIYDGKQMRNFTTIAGKPITLVTGVVELRKDHLLLLSSTHDAYVWKDGRLGIDSLTFRDCRELRGAFRTGPGSWLLETFRGLYRFSAGKLGLVTDYTPFREAERGYVEALGVMDNQVYLQQLGPKGTTLIAYDWKQKRILQTLALPYGAQGFPPGREGIAFICDEQFLYIPFRQGQMLPASPLALPEAWGKLPRIKPIYFLDGKAWYQLRTNQLAELDARTGEARYYPLNQTGEWSYYHAFRDREGNAWLLAFGLGAVKLEPVSFRKESDVQSYYSMVADPEGLLLMGNDHSVWRRTGSTDTRIASLPKEARPFLFSMGGDAWYLLRNELRSFRGQRIELPEALRTDKPYAFSQRVSTDAEGNTLLAGEFLVRIRPPGRLDYLRLPYFADMAVCTAPGVYWIFCRSDEAVRVEERNGTLAITARQMLPGLAARCVHLVGQNRIWVGTRMSGIRELEYRDRWVEKGRYGIAQGLSNNFVTAINPLGEGQYLLATASGLDLMQCRGGDTLIERISAAANVFSQMAKTLVRGDTVFARSIEGELFSWTPPERRGLGFRPQLYLSGVSANGLAFASGERSFGYRQNNLRFEAAAPSFIRNRELQFLFELRSGDRSWVQKTTSPVFEINNLEPGDYTLQVRASFPARIYPDQHLSYAFHIRQPFWQTLAFRVLLVVLLASLIIVVVQSVYVRKLRQQRLLLEKKQAIEKERTRIATDMHDDLGAGLSRIKFLSEKLQLQNRSLPISAELNKISSYSDEMSEKMGEIVWALNQRYDSAGDLVSFTRAYASEFLEDKKIALHFESELPEDRPLNGEIRRNLFLVIKEALNNIAKHSGATEVEIRFAVGDSLSLLIADNGKGFETAAVRPFANGLENMRRRVEEIGGSFRIQGNGGTKLFIQIARLPR